MKRVLCAALLGAAALATPASAAQDIGVRVTPSTEGRVGVFVSYKTSGDRYYPLGGAYYDTTTGEACVGFSYQIPQCAGGPIE